MRIISQNGSLDIPYSDDVILSVEDKGERTLVFALVKDTENSFGSYVLGSYEHKNIALIQLEDLRIAFENDCKCFYM